VRRSLPRDRVWDWGAPPANATGPNAFACRLSALSNATLPSSWGYTAHPLLGGANGSDAAVQRAYEGTVARAAQVYAGGGPDVLMLWTQIQSTPEDFAATARELPLAQAALTAAGLGPRVRLATGGWNLGPPDNATYLDGVAAPDVTLASLLGDEGCTDPTPAFGEVR
jgi:hypothetical protein